MEMNSAGFENFAPSHHSLSLSLCKKQEREGDKNLHFGCQSALKHYEASEQRKLSTKYHIV
jgi:hypothetical protein